MFGIKPDLIEPANTRQAVSDYRDDCPPSFRDNDLTILRLRTSKYD